MDGEQEGDDLVCGLAWLYMAFRSYTVMFVIVLAIDSRRSMVVSRKRAIVRDPQRRGQFFWCYINLPPRPFATVSRCPLPSSRVFVVPFVVEQRKRRRRSRSHSNKLPLLTTTSCQSTAGFSKTQVRTLSKMPRPSVSLRALDCPLQMAVTTPVPVPVPVPARHRRSLVARCSLIQS